MDEVNQLVTVGVQTVQRALTVGNDTIHGLQGWARPVGLPRRGRARPESACGLRRAEVDNHRQIQTERPPWKRPPKQGRRHERVPGNRCDWNEFFLLGGSSGRGHLHGEGSVRDIRVAEVTKHDIVVGDGGALVYRTKLQLSFKYESE